MLNHYLSSPTRGGSVQPTDFHDLYTSGEFLVIPAQYGYIAAAFNNTSDSPAYFAAKLGIANLTASLGATFARDRLDAVIYPQQKNLVVPVGAPSQSGRNGILAALTGSPVVMVPAGFSVSSAGAPRGIPIGMEVLGQPWTEDRLLNIAQHISELAPVRVMPAFADRFVEVKTYDRMPIITPNRGTIPAAYPVGKLH